MDAHDPAAGAGAGQAVPMAAAAPPGAVVVPVAVAAPQPAAGAAPNWTTLRLRWAKALVLLGFAAAALAMFAINSSSSTAPALGASCALTDHEAAHLRAVAEELLLAAAAQVLGATTSALVPERRLVSFFATALGWVTGFYASDVLWLLVACHGHVHGGRLAFYCIFIFVFFVAFVVGFGVAMRGPRVA